MHRLSTNGLLIVSVAAWVVLAVSVVGTAAWVAFVRNESRAADQEQIAENTRRIELGRERSERNCARQLAIVAEIRRIDPSTDIVERLRLIDAEFPDIQSCRP